MKIRIRNKVKKNDKKKLKKYERNSKKEITFNGKSKQFVHRRYLNGCENKNT